MDPLIGRVIDQRYRIDSRLGAGGMGVVYRAHQLRVGRDVALKVIQGAGRLDEAATKRFLREGQLASALQHPNTVTVFDIGKTDDGLLYLVMELLDGRSLQEVLREEGVLPPDRAIRIAILISQGLEAVHSAGIVHRDLKPGNVMLVPHSSLEDWVKLLDFGLAKRQAPLVEDETVTRAGAIAGTVAFMAPEVIRGGTPDERSDLYALGVVLYEMVTGSRPYQASSEEALLAKVLTEEPAPLPDELPSGLKKVIERLLSKDPAERFENAAIAREFLRAAAEGDARVHPVTRPDRLPPDTDPEVHSPGTGQGSLRSGRLKVGLLLLGLLLGGWGLSQLGVLPSDAEKRGSGAGGSFEESTPSGAVGEQGDAAPTTRFDGRYVGHYRSEGGDLCTGGQLRMQVTQGQVTGEAWATQTNEAENFEVFDLVATVERTGVCHGTFRYRGGVVGAFTGRFLRDRASGDSSDSTYGCRGTWEVRRDTAAD